MKSRHLLLWAAVLTGVTAIPGAAFASSAPIQLHADSSVFLANIDDDAGVCQARARKLVAEAGPREDAEQQAFSKKQQELQKLAKTEPERAEREYAELQRTHRIAQYQTDRDLARCNDADDDVVNGPEDAKDLDRLHIPAYAASEPARIEVPGHVHVFVKRAQWEMVRPGTELSVDELRHGVELGVEGTDVVRDTAKWDGRATIRVTSGTATAVAALKEAPLLTQNDIQPAQQVLTPVRPDDPDYDKALDAATPVPLVHVDFGKDGENWMQDILEPMYQTMTGPDGRPHGMRVLLTSVDSAHRVSSRVAFTQLAGRNVAAIHVEHAFVAGEKEGENSLGNLETVPPSPGHPDGQILIGDKPAAEVMTLLRSQGAQDIVTLDTSWLTVGHVDEFVHFVPAPGTRLGWRMLVSDPWQGMEILRNSGHPELTLHGNLPTIGYPYDQYVDKRTIGEFLADKQFAATNERAAERIDAGVGVLKATAGLTDTDIVRVPALFTYRDLIGYWMLRQQIERMPPGPDRDKAQQKLDSLTISIAQIPNAVNGVTLNNGRYLAPKTYGPSVGGKDIFADAVTRTLHDAGVDVHYVDDFLALHLDDGELHCGTNVYREVPI